MVPGEDFDGTASHFFPTALAVRTWVRGAGLETLIEGVGNFYRYFLLRRPAG